MPSTTKLLIVSALAVAVALVLVLKSLPAPAQPESAPPVTNTISALPKIVCLGAGKCIPCKAMEPVREELRRDYSGRMIVEFHDVWKDPDIGRRFRIRLIPTTIFYDASGKELARGEGFMSKDDILAQFKQLGVSL